MVTIAVIGANGQVGAEVCLYLHQMDGVEVVPICRTELGAAPLRKWGLEPRCGVLDAPERAGALLSGADLVVDFSLPRTGQSEARTIAKRTLTLAISQAPPNARFVYISTIMAFGMRGDGGRFRPYIVARTPYATFKRWAERTALRLGRAGGREVTVLRLGEVHGELQRVSNALIARLEDRTAYVPENASYTVFVPTIAEALVNIAHGKERPGVYCLVSHPQWTWVEVYRHYLEQSAFESEVRSLPREDSQRLGALRSRLSAAARFVVGGLSSAALDHRELVAAHLFAHAPKLEARFRAAFQVRRARAEIAEIRAADLYRPYSEPYLGVAPGRRLVSLSDSRGNSSMQELTRRVREALGAATAPPE